MTIDLKHITVAFDYTSGDIADIKRCLECLYQTAEGTCPLDREFGLNTDFVGMPMDVAKSQFAVEIIDKTHTDEFWKFRRQQRRRRWQLRKLWGAFLK